MEWKVIASKEGTTQKVYAGWEKEVFRGQPPRVDGWSIVLVVESQSSELVTGHMTFPERAQFEFAGSLEQMLKAIREAEGESNCVQSQVILRWRQDVDNLLAKARRTSTRR